MKLFLKTLLLLLLPAFSIAQHPADSAATSHLDSLKTAFFNATDDSTARDRTEKLMLFYMSDNTKTAEEKLGELESLIKKKGEAKFNYFLLLFRVVLTHTTDSIIETRKYLNEFLRQCRRFDNKTDYVLGQTFLAQKESYAGNYNEALKLLLNSLDYARDTLKDKRIIGGVYLTLGIFYYDQHDTLRAIEFNKKALAAATEVKNTDDMASVSNNLAMQYSDLGMYDSAKVYFRQSIRLFRMSDINVLLSNPLINLALVYRLTHDYDNAIFYAREGIRNAIDRDYEESYAGGYYVLAQTFRDMGKPDSALKYYDLSKKLFEKINSQSALRDFYPDLAAFYASQGNHKPAYEYLQKATAIKDLVFSANNNKVLKEMDAKYQASKKEQALLKQEEQIKRQRILTYSVMAVAAFFLLLVFFIYRSNRLKQKSNKLLGIAKEKAEQSEKFKQQFLANMSHEIRTPMNAVMGMTNLVLDTPLNSKQKFYLEGISKSSDNLLHIINDILDLSKIESGKIELEQIDFSVRDLVEQVKQLLQHKADEKGLELMTDIDSRVPEIVTGDPGRLTQVLINLAGNAIKFTEKGSVSINVSAGEEGTKQPGHTGEIASSPAMTFKIIDTGIGIPKDKLETVFESFSQAHSSDTRKFGGTGLGLTISKQLVELMGGKISIESEEGAGTVFSFEINCPVGSKEKMNAQKSAEQVDGSILNGLKILVVDDNEYNRIVVHDTLKSKASVEIAQAVNGKEAVELAGENDFDVILMDVQMPLMNGYEATRHIREKFAAPKNQTPVIALTASVVRSDLDKCRAAGMNDYVPKPFKTSQLFTAIAKAVGRNASPTSPKSEKALSHEPKPPRQGDSEGVTNLSYLQNFCEGDKERMQKYVNMFLATAPALIEKVNSAIAKNDFEEIANQVHGFKTRWIMMGMNETKNIALKIEQQCRQQPPDTSVKENIELLVLQIQQAGSELKIA